MLPIPTPGDLPDPGDLGIKPVCPVLTGGFFLPLSHWGIQNIRNILADVPAEVDVRENKGQGTKEM